MRILGISAFYHDSAAALIEDGAVVFAAQEERYTRRKHDPDFPENAIRSCLDHAGIPLEQVDRIVFYEKPFIKFERLLETYMAFAPRGLASFRQAMPIWLREKLFLKQLLCDRLSELAPGCAFESRLLFSEHHLSHAASAFYPSPYERALVLTMDGVGEWATTSLAVGDGARLDILKELHFPHSLGLLYSAFTYYTGFRVNSGEYKLMGLAPYGQPRFRDLIMERLIDVKGDGSFRLDLRYFDYCTGLTMTSPRFHDLFGGEPRRPEAPLTQRDMDLAASIQVVTEDVVLRLADGAARETGLDRLCLAGGVALNCVANGKLLRNGAFRDIWIQPAAGDAGGALGAALLAWHQHEGQARVVKPHDAMLGSFLGPEYSQEQVESALRECGAHFEVLEDAELLDRTARDLAAGKAVGWFQGRMEFGPRALGARSILGDARSPTMQSVLNLKVKFRESFRPFAPSVLREDVADWFELDRDSPYMLLVADVAKEHRIDPGPDAARTFGLEQLKLRRSEIPAVTHVDYSARVQTVHRETHPKYHALISRFKELTGCPVIVNTSFNVRGEPIVCTPGDAFRCFMGTDIDALAIGSCYLEKPSQPPGLRADYQHRFEPD